MALDKLYYRRNQDGTLFIIVNRCGVASLRKVTGWSREVAIRFGACPYAWSINEDNTPLGLSIFEEMDRTYYLEIPEGMTVDFVKLSSAPRINIHDCFIPIK